MTKTKTPRFSVPVPRRVRRALVLATYLGYLAWMAALALLPSPLLWLVAVPAAAATLYGLARLLIEPKLGTSDRADQELDERQLHLRNAAYLSAYRIVGALVVSALIYAQLATDFGWWLPDTYNAWQAVFWGAWILVVTLPTALLAWSEPDLDA